MGSFPSKGEGWGRLPVTGCPKSALLPTSDNDRTWKPESALCVQFQQDTGTDNAMQNSLGAFLAAGLFTLATGAAQAAEGVPNFNVEPTCRGATRPEAAMRDKDGEAA